MNRVAQQLRLGMAAALAAAMFAPRSASAQSFGRPFSEVPARPAPQFIPPQPYVTREIQTVDASVGVLNEVMSIPARQIPASLLARAEGVVIVPNMIKGGFVIGARRGNGVLLVRDEMGNWQAPSFVTMTGGSVGFQAGLQSTDVILVFQSRKSIDNLLQGKFTIGADAAVAAGPVGRQAEAATDLRLRAEIYSYSRSRGLFAGVALDGSVLEIDQDATQSYYRPQADGQAQLPASAMRLLEQLSQYSPTVVTTPQPIVVDTAPTPAPPPLLANGAVRVETLRGELTAAARQLDPLLDAQWKQYLALPPDVYQPNGRPDVAALRDAATRFDSVSGSPQYQALTVRPEFQACHAVLHEYLAAASAPGPISVPPPPR